MSIQLITTRRKQGCCRATRVPQHQNCESTSTSFTVLPCKENRPGAPALVNEARRSSSNASPPCHSVIGCASRTRYPLRQRPWEDLVGESYRSRGHPESSEGLLWGDRPSSTNTVNEARSYSIELPFLGVPMPARDLDGPGMARRNGKGIRLVVAIATVFHEVTGPRCYQTGQRCSFAPRAKRSATHAPMRNGPRSPGEEPACSQLDGSTRRT